MTDPAQTVEAPSGKNTAYENFPVGSWLLPAPLRPHVAIFYAFARAADDIADSPDLAADDKIARLEGFERALTGSEPPDSPYEKAMRMRESLAVTGADTRHCLDLLAAFKQDATKNRYRDWDDLIGYCLLSAAPVGRYLLDLHGEERSSYPTSDALCIALQILNHLQDCGNDYRTLDRVYLPERWFQEAGLAIEDLAASASRPGLRGIIDRALDETNEILKFARPLPSRLSNRRLAMESATIFTIAVRLAAKLRHCDPLGRRVVLSKSEYASSFVSGVFNGLFGAKAA